jgi:multiple sugar transport system substrate-binding protein
MKGWDRSSVSKEKQISRRDFIKIAGAAGTAGAVLAACGATPEPTNVPEAKPTVAPVVVGKPFAGKTVRMLAISDANHDELYKLIPAWEQETGATVEFVSEGNEVETDKRLLQDFAAGTVDYDVCWDHSSFFSQYVKADGLEPLDDYFREEELDDFIPAVLNAGRKEDKLWIIPSHYDISCLYWRTDLITKDQVPETWDDFKALAIQITDDNPGIFGTQFAGKEEALSGRFNEVLLAEGGRLLGDDWMPVFNDPAGVKAATMFAELYAAGAMPPGMIDFAWEDLGLQWMRSIIGMYTEWFGWYGYFQDPEASKVAGKFELARQPKGDGDVHSGWAGCHGFSITKASEEKEMAASLIKYLTSVEGNRIAGSQGYLVSQQSVWAELISQAADSENHLEKKRLELAFLQAREDFATQPLIAEWIPLSNILFPVLQQIILGDLEPQKGLDDAAEQVWTMLSKAGYYN